MELAVVATPENPLPACLLHSSFPLALITLSPCVHLCIGSFLGHLYFLFHCSNAILLFLSLALFYNCCTTLLPPSLDALSPSSNLSISAYSSSPLNARVTFIHAFDPMFICLLSTLLPSKYASYDFDFCSVIECLFRFFQTSLAAIMTTLNL